MKLSAKGKRHLGLIVYIYICILLTVSHYTASILSYLFLLTTHFDLQISLKNTHLKLQKPTLTKAVQIRSAQFFSKWPFCYHLTLRGHNFILALCTVLLHLRQINAMVDWALKITSYLSTSN